MIKPEIDFNTTHLYWCYFSCGVQKAIWIDSSVFHLDIFKAYEELTERFNPNDFIPQLLTTYIQKQHIVLLQVVPEVQRSLANYTIKVINESRTVQSKRI